MKILLINGSKKFGHSNAELNETLINVAYEFLISENNDIKITNIDEGYDINEEIEKILWADLVIHQIPLWWMAEPWIVKKYIDEVFTAGHGILYKNDGRTRTNPDFNYGKGGLLKNKYVLLSITLNAPINAFDNKSEFFEGKSIDDLFLHFYKAHEFLGFEKLKVFMCNDVMKNPKIDQFRKKYTEYLKDILILINEKK